MGEAAFACFYFLFSIMFAIVNVIMQDVTVRSQMFTAVIDKYVGMPYKYKPEKRFAQISVPSELEQWLQQSFVPVTFGETPREGDVTGYCTSGTPCHIDQGDCDRDDQCQEGLSCSDKSILSSGMMVNGNYWDTDELVDWCNWQGTPVDLLRNGVGIPVQYQICNATPVVTGTALGQSPCCWDDLSNEYITLISNASDPSFGKTSLKYIGRANCPTSTSAGGDCCAKKGQEPLNKTETLSMSNALRDHKRPVTVGNFNRVLMLRFSMKRYKQVPTVGASPAFSYLTPTILSGSGSPLLATVDNGDQEDKTAFTGMAYPVSKHYKWVTNESYAKSGGYVEWLNPSDGPSFMGMTLERMRLDGLFDNKLATFTIDMLLYNGNSDTFMTVMFQFQFDPSGACDKRTDVMYSNLKGMKGNAVIAKTIEYFFLIPAVVFFIVWEIKKMMDVSWITHFASPNSWIDMFSLLLCTFVLIMNFVIQLDKTYTDFSFDVNDPKGFSDTKLFLDMVDLQALISIQVYLVAINLLMIFFRSVVLITALEGNLGLIIATLGQAMVNIMYFSVTFLFLLIGFVAFAFFTFGSNPRDSGMTTPTRTFFKTFAMLLGRQDFEGLEKADPIMAIFFFFAFYIMVLFVMLNMFISILLSGYDVCDFELKKKLAAGKPVSLTRKIYDDFRIDVFGRVSGPLISCVTATWNSLIKPFVVGILSCFMGCVKACDCGIRLPSTKRLTDAKDSMFGKSSEMDGVKELKKETTRGHQLLKKSKSAAIKKFETTFPPKAEVLREFAKAVDECIKANADQKKEMEKTGDEYKVTDDEVEALRNFNTDLEVAMEEALEHATMQEKLCMLMFMVVFVLMLITMTRGEDSYWVAKATLDPAIKETWVVNKPLRRSQFDDIDSMQEAGEWASVVLVNELYKETACMVREGTKAPATVDLCNTNHDDQQLVQKLNNWNIGFMKTTFVRISIQPACYVNNKEDRWIGGASYLRSPTMGGACAGKSCFSDALAAEGTCKNSAGEVIHKDKVRVSSSLTEDRFYNYSEPAFLGPVGMAGGFAVSLGTTRASGKAMLETLISDMWFTKNSAAITFDWITYNGNLDMFTYNVISFNLLETGTLETTRTTLTFPLNVVSGGGPFHGSRLMIEALFIIYVILVAYFIGDQILGMLKQRQKSKRAKQPFYYFFIAYYKSTWNRTDTLSLVITVVSVMIYLNFISEPFRNKYKFALAHNDKYQVPPAAVKQFGLVAEVDPRRALQDDWYIFSQMESIGTTYNMYLNLAAVNAFFIAVKVVKYANTVEHFRIYASTIAEGSERMLYFAVVIILLLVGWSLFFMVLFGVYDNSVSDLFASITTCFTWMLGDFELDKMLVAREECAIIFFLLFEVMMYFICINMFLATMLNTYSETVGKLEVIAEKQKMEDEREHDFVVVEYEDKETLKRDITIKKDDLGEVWVLSVRDGGQAAALKVLSGGPSKGSLVLKVNGDKSDWKEHATEEEIIEDGIQPDVRTQRILVTFKSPRMKDRGWFGKVLQMGGQTPESAWAQRIRPTVKTFWRKHGAVTWTHAEVMKYERTEEPEDDVAEGDSADGAAKEDGEKVEKPADASEMKAVRTRVKKKLDSLLFSRAARGTADGADAFDIANFDSRAGGTEAVAGEEAKIETDIEIDELRNRIEVEPVTGDEVWLDCLMTQIEHEMEDESVVTEVLRTVDMQETHRGQGPQKQDSLNSFYRVVTDILSILECKAKQKWYKCLQEESQSRLEMFKKQNDILHDYACELEAEFADIMQKIHVFKAKKDMMIMKLAGVLDKQYKQLDTSGLPEDTTHLTRLSIPWPDAMVSGRGHALTNI